MTTEKEQLEAEIAERDARIAELERQGAALAASYCDGVIGDSYGHAYCKYKADLAALKAQQPSAGVACALMSALEGIVHDQRVPNEVSQECAAVLIEARRLNPNPAGSGVVLPERAEAERQAAELREEHDILQKKLDRFYSQSHGITALSEIERLHAQIATLKEIRIPILPPQCTDKLHHVKYRAGWNCCLSEVARLNPCRAQCKACGGFGSDCDECGAPPAKKESE